MDARSEYSNPCYFSDWPRVLPSLMEDSSKIAGILAVLEKPWDHEVLNGSGLKRPSACDKPSFGWTLEMTGLQVERESDVIIEAAALVTDLNFNRAHML
jgi:hypothetical protein